MPSGTSDETVCRDVWDVKLVDLLNIIVSSHAMRDDGEVANGEVGNGELARRLRSSASKQAS